MTEAQVGLLIKAASLLPQNKISQILKSYYLTRCKLVTKNFGLPKKHFSNQVRCSRCCMEWNNDVEVKLEPIKLTKRQRRRIKAQAKLSNSRNRTHLLHSSKLIRDCSFCGKNTTIILPKPKVQNDNQIVGEKTSDNLKNYKINNKKKEISKGKNNLVHEELQSTVYWKSKEAFSLKEKKNTLQSTIKQSPIKIKNNKKKKDKFAGLCQQAVIAATQLKQEKENKLNLFLKPSKT